jgi:hypothetical protein
MKDAEKLAVAYRPPDRQAMAMITHLLALYGVEALAGLLDVERRAIMRWRAGCAPRQGNLRLIWLLHCLTFEPWKLSSAFHVLTWGKFARPGEAVGKAQPLPQTWEDGAGI